MKDIIEILVWFLGLLRGFFALIGQEGLIDEITSHLLEFGEKE